MLSKRDNETLTRVGPGTPMGNLMRRYWHPVAGTSELDASPFRTKEVRVLGEDLVLYRDRSGQIGLIDRWCSHRRVNMAYGVVEQDGLRCQYHGWKFDASGACIEQPFEATVHPDGRFREKCGVVGYPTREACGLVFAYLGPAPIPELPIWEPMSWQESVLDIAVTELPCNWLQCQENSLDPVHAEWLHGQFSAYLREMLDLPIQNRVNFGRSLKHTKIGFDIFEHGMIKRRIVEGTTEEHDSWRIGHPVMFPHILLVGDQYSSTLQWRVPIDDTRTYHVSLYIFPAAPGAAAPRQESVPFRITQLYDEQGQWVLDYTFNQDFMAWSQQGPIAERNREKLGESDKGIILFRRLLQQQLQRLERGEPLMNVFTDPAQAACVELPLERHRVGVRRRPDRYIPGEGGRSVDADKIDAVHATWDAAANPA